MQSTTLAESPLMGKRCGWGYFIGRAFIWCLSLTFETSQLSKTVKRHGNDECSRWVYCALSWLISHMHSACFVISHVRDLYIPCVGFLRCPSRQFGQCEGLEGEMGKEKESHAFLYQLYINKSDIEDSVGTRTKTTQYGKNS